MLKSKKVKTRILSRQPFNMEILIRIVIIRARVLTRNKQLKIEKKKLD